VSEKLPDLPEEWGYVDTPLEGRFYQRWMPGAFGDRTTLSGVKRYHVLRDEWDENDDLPRRTILEARVVE
jgi:hypothetical protein